VVRSKSTIGWWVQPVESGHRHRKPPKFAVGHYSSQALKDGAGPDAKKFEASAY